MTTPSTTTTCPDCGGDGGTAGGENASWGRLYGDPPEHCPTCLGTGTIDKAQYAQAMITEPEQPPPWEEIVRIVSRIPEDRLDGLAQAMGVDPAHDLRTAHRRYAFATYAHTNTTLWHVLANY